MKPTLVRQGDVPIVATTIPAGAVPVKRDGGRVILAYGEVTGHAHAIHGAGAVAFVDPTTQQQFVRIMESSRIDLRPTGFVEPIDDTTVRVQDASGIIVRFPRDMEARCAAAFGTTLTLPGEMVQHEEHDAIVLAPGDYELPGQREYTSADMQPIRVAD
jgi:hypothetical protein